MPKKETDINTVIDGYVVKAQKALSEFMDYTQEEIDK